MIAQLYVETEVFRHHTYRVLTRLAHQGTPGPEASLTKLYWSEMEARIYETGLRIMGPEAELVSGPQVAAAPDPTTALAWETWSRHYWYARAAKIYAGTSEIQKTIIAERVLGLPRVADGQG